MVNLLTAESIAVMYNNRNIAFVLITVTCTRGYLNVHMGTHSHSRKHSHTHKHTYTHAHSHTHKHTHRHTHIAMMGQHDDY